MVGKDAKEEEGRERQVREGKRKGMAGTLLG